MEIYLLAFVDSDRLILYCDLPVGQFSSSVAQLCPTLRNPHQAPPSMGFSRQEYWSGVPFPSPEDLPNPGIEPGSPT